MRGAQKLEPYQARDPADNRRRRPDDDRHLALLRVRDLTGRRQPGVRAGESGHRGLEPVATAPPSSSTPHLLCGAAQWMTRTTSLSTIATSARGVTAPSWYRIISFTCMITVPCPRTSHATTS